MLEYAGMKWYLLELTFYGTGVALYAVCLPSHPSPRRDKGSDKHLQFRIPERLAPGKFDIWGSSHQIFHVAILFAMYTHLAAMLQGFTSAYTLDMCQLRGVKGAS